MLLQSSYPNRVSLASKLVQPDPSLRFAETGVSNVGVGSFLVRLLLFQLMGAGVADATLHAPGPKAIRSGSLKYGGRAPRLGWDPSPSNSFRLSSLRIPVLVGSTSTGSSDR